MKTYLVTGGAGFIGSNLALEFEKMPNTKVIVLDDFSVGNETNLKNFKGKIIRADISKFDWTSLDVDVVFHQAAITDTTVTNEEKMLNING